MEILYAIIEDFNGEVKRAAFIFFPGAQNGGEMFPPLRLRGLETLREALIKATCADLRQKFLLTRKKIAGILTDFKIF